MTGIPDEFTRMETACAILRDYGSDLLGDGGREIYEADYATRIFEAIGLPALLERVEAAEGAVVRLTQINHSFIATPTGDMHDLIAERDALTAKVARGLVLADAAIKAAENPLSRGPYGERSTARTIDGYELRAALTADSTYEQAMGCDECGRPATHVTTPGGLRGCDDHFKGNA